MTNICLLKVVGQKGTISSGTGPESLESLVPGLGSFPVNSTAFMPKSDDMKESGSFGGIS